MRAGTTHNETTRKHRHPLHHTPAAPQSAHPPRNSSGRQVVSAASRRPGGAEKSIAVRNPTQECRTVLHQSYTVNGLSTVLRYISPAGCESAVRFSSRLRAAHTRWRTMTRAVQSRRLVRLLSPSIERLSGNRPVLRGLTASYPLETCRAGWW